jgi:hypothetical protein
MLDRYFYIIERDEDDEKCIHLEGNIYFNDDGSEKDWRVAEYYWLYLDIDTAKRMIRDNTFYEYANASVAGLSDATQKEAETLCAEYYGDEEPGTELHIKDITEDTPYGCYWFEER